jgi:hypothetical protein
MEPPFMMDERWKEHRQAARRKEIIVGVLTWLVGTGTGVAVLLGILVGIAIGIWGERWAVEQER